MKRQFVFLVRETTQRLKLNDIQLRPEHKPHAGIRLERKRLACKRRVSDVMGCEGKATVREPLQVQQRPFFFYGLLEMSAMIAVASRQARRLRSSPVTASYPP